MLASAPTRTPESTFFRPQVGACVCTGVMYSQRPSCVGILTLVSTIVVVIVMVVLLLPGAEVVVVVVVIVMVLVLIVVYKVYKQ